MLKVFSHIKTLTILIFSLQILNTGLFAQDFQTNSTNLNIINSAVEYITEVVMDKGDVFPESHQHNHHKHHKHSHNFNLKVQHCVLFKHTPQSNNFTFKEEVIVNKYLLENNIRLQNIIFDITPPPPKA